MTSLKRFAPPLVSVIIPTRNRPQFLPIALACYRLQRYRNRELIVIDDGDMPVDEAAIVDVGGRLIRHTGSPSVGLKLNIAIAHARGTIIQRMDDDDYYAPNFIRRMVQSLLLTRQDICKPVAIGMLHRLVLDLRTWELRRHPGPTIGGNALAFYRADWEDSPFRPLSHHEDTWFEKDILRLGGDSLMVDARKSIVIVRHSGHAWTTMPYGIPVRSAMRDWPAHPRPPESVLPRWVIRRYAAIREELLQSGAADARLT